MTEASFPRFYKAVPSTKQWHLAYLANLAIPFFTLAGTVCWLLVLQSFWCVLTQS